MTLLRIGFIICFFCLQKAYATTIIYTDPNNNMVVSKYIEIFEDNTNKLKIKDVISLNDFKSYTQEVPNLGVTTSSFWIKIEIENKTNLSNLLLNLEYPILDQVDFYSISLDGKIDSISMGEYLPFHQRIHNDPNYILDLNIPPNQTKTFYLKIKSGEQILVPLILGSSASLYESILNKNTLFGLYVGIMIVMLFYNLFIFFSVRDKIYLFYVVYLIMVALTQTHLQGYTFKYLWPNSPWMAIHSMFLTPSLVGIAIAEFIKVFLKTKENVPILHKGLNIISGVYIVCILLGLFGYYNESQKIIHVNAMAISLYGLFIAIKISRQGFRTAKFFLIAWTIFLIGVCVFILKDFGVLPFNNFTTYMMPAGSALEVILLSFALADRINILKKEKEESQLEMLIALQENKNLITEQNIVLEKKVHERTQALEVANIELGVTLSNLKDAQTQLVDAEKMASLGQLTAGIAHEINNPINFVSANVKPLKMDIKDVFDVLKKYESITPNDQIERQLKEIDTFKSEIDINYIKNEIDQLLSGIEDGAKRTAEIVSGLKNFSRLDEGDLKLANINDGIKSTLVLLRSNIPDYIKLTTNLGDIPSVECYPGKLNQVFMNILNNAIDAMVQKKAQQKHELTIATYTDGENVCVTIVDTGMGMKPEVKAKIFEPFFTTKDVGSGTGLGMSIVFKIMESHHGRIEIESEYESGTKIILTLHKKIELL